MCESRFNISWQLPKDGVSMIKLIPITKLGLSQEMPVVIESLSRVYVK